MSGADQAVETARTERITTAERHRTERLVILASEFGAENARAHQYGMRTLNPNREVRDARTQAAALRAQAELLRALPVQEAARLIETARADQEHVQQQAAERERQLGDPFHDEPRRADARHEPPARGL